LYIYLITEPENCAVQGDWFLDPAIPIVDNVVKG
jgi:hypothetical protein